MRMWIRGVYIYIGLHMFLVGVKSNNPVHSSVKTHLCTVAAKSERTVLCSRTQRANPTRRMLSAAISAWTRWMVQVQPFTLQNAPFRGLWHTKDTSHNSMLAPEWSATVFTISCLATSFWLYLHDLRETRMPPFHTTADVRAKIF